MKSSDSKTRKTFVGLITPLIDFILQTIINQKINFWANSRFYEIFILIPSFFQYILGFLMTANNSNVYSMI